MIMRQVQEMQEPVVESTELLPLPPQVYALSQFLVMTKLCPLTFPYHARFGSEVKMQIIKDSHGVLYPPPGHMSEGKDQTTFPCKIGKN